MVANSRKRSEVSEAEKVPEKRLKGSKVLDEIPGSSHYQVSFMHRATVTHVLSSVRHGYVITACEDGVIKFWKRTSAMPPEEDTSNPNTAQKATTPCLEFVKSFTAHIGGVASLCLDPSEGTAASIGEDGLIKVYDVSTFDATAMVKSGKSFGPASCLLEDGSKDLLLAISHALDGAIFIYSVTSLQQIQMLTFHSKPVTSLSYNQMHKCCLSADKSGLLDVWDCTSGTKRDEVVGAVCTQAKNEITFVSKLKTHLIKLVKKKAYAQAIAMSRHHFAVYASDRIIYIFDLRTGMIEVRFDERIETYNNSNGHKTGMDSIDFGKRYATERELELQPNIPNSQMVQMDPSGEYVLVSTIVGIKIYDWKRKKIVKTIGKVDASQLRFLSFCLCLGDPKQNQQMQLARGASTAVAVGEEKIVNDDLIVALAFNQRRFYVFSHLDPFENAESVDEVKRDVWNEAPTAQDQLLASSGKTNGTNSAGNQFTKAILRTSVGDIHIKLFTEVVKTIENFCGHARAGYYDNVLFHRVIQGFMIQTGDPMGDGTGGESIWGGEFEDEFVRELRHDRPFTLSMANCGPNTNGSQFFITTVPTPWLDNKHTVFGRVERGMDICAQIENVKTDKMDKPLEDIRIISIDVE